jgi:hypothetical protein
MGLIPLETLIGVVTLVALFAWSVMVAVADVLQLHMRAGKLGIWHLLVPVLLLLAVVLGIVAAEIGLRWLGAFKAR